MPLITIETAEELVEKALKRAGFSPWASSSTAQALVLAESQGISSHGLSRISQYISHLRNGRINPEAKPVVRRALGGCSVVDAQCGLAFPACKLAIDEGIRLAKSLGISVSAVVNSHHAGVIADHLRKPALEGLVGIGLCNAPAVMPTARGRHPVMGTNPIAAAFPRRGESPLLIDLSLSEVSRATLVAAAKSGMEIPLGWATDSSGNPTTKPEEALQGSMLAIGSATSVKGAVLAMMVELLSSALIGANYSFEATSFFRDEGNTPRLGHTFVLIDPEFLAGRDNYLSRIEIFVAELLQDNEVRLPGMRREMQYQNSKLNGIEIPASMLDFLSPPTV